MTSGAEPIRPSFARRLATALYRRPRLQLGLLLAPPVGALVIAYLGSLALLLVNAFWRFDAFTGSVVTTPTLDNFSQIVTTSVFRDVAVRTILTAAAVTVTDALVAFPMAYFMARVAPRRTRNVLLVAVVLPLWSGYLVKVYAWRLILLNDGFADSVLAPFGLHGPGLSQISAWIVFSYLWLPYMILPIYAGLERIPGSLLEASGDLGARAVTTFRRVILPLTLPAVVAGSIFTFSLTLGDYVTPRLVAGGTQFIGNVVYDNIGVVGNVPLAAAYATVPILVMLVYLLLARRTGAFESL
ncbi:MAG TPA: ABC transporter permease [Candidatus Limnocylindria bacterium]|nr:ABC transporter permease [Candidatus Limnocylindria bacterium]